MTVLQLVLLLVLVLLIVGVVIVLNMNKEAERRRRTMSVITGGQVNVPQKGKEDENEAQNKRRAEIAKKLKESKGGEEDGKKKKTISLSLQQAGLKMSVTQFWIFSVVLMVVAVLLAVVTGQSPLVIILVAVTALLGLPRLFLKMKAGKRQKKFLIEFADALEAVVRLLKAGMPVAEAVAMISREFSGPVGEEMSIMFDKQKIGVPLHEAAYEAAERMPLPEMQMFATGLAIQAQTGSSLSDVLQNLAHVIRQRFRLKRKVKALASEAVASASIIGALPNLLGLGLYFVNREYISVLFTDPFGKVLLAGAVFWMCCGVIVMKVMINFKV